MSPEGRALASAHLSGWTAREPHDRFRRPHDYHYYIVSATHTPDCQVLDITGEELIYKKADDLLITRVTLDLDRGIYCTDSVDANNGGSLIRDRLLKEHGDDIMQDKYIERDGWFVLKAKRPGASARELARSYGLEELRDFIQHCRQIVDQRRRWEFAEKLFRKS